MYQLQGRRSDQALNQTLCSRTVGLTGYLGHGAKDCKNNRVFDMSSIADATAEVAWDNLEKADAEKDLDEIRAVGETAQQF